MAMVLLTAHCWVLQGSHNYSVFENARTSSLISCSLRCKHLVRSVGFTFVDDTHRPIHIFNGSSKSKHRKYLNTTGPLASKARIYQSGVKGLLKTGQCFCLSRSDEHRFPVGLIDSKHCIFKTEHKLLYGDRCSLGSKCNGTDVSCIKGHCGCEAGYRYDKKKNRCTKQTPHYGDKCTRGSKCNGRDVSCIQGHCGCEAGYRYDKKKNICTKRQPHYGDKCSMTRICKGIAVSCIKGHCGCKTGYRYDKKKNRCTKRQPHYGDKCSRSRTCKGIAVSCIHGNCGCKTGYRYLKKKNRCTKRKRKFGHNCGAKDRCEGKGALCLHGLCRCPTGYRYKKKESACKKKLPKFHDGCEDENWLCKPGCYFLPKTKTCVKSCMKYSGAMLEYKGLGIKGHNDRIVDPYSDLYTSRRSFIDMCKLSCVYETSFTCKTVDFIFTKDKKKCLLSKDGYWDVGKDEREVGQKDWSLLVRNCVY